MEVKVKIDHIYYQAMLLNDKSSILVMAEYDKNNEVISLSDYSRFYFEGWYKNSLSKLGAASYKKQLSFSYEKGLGFFTGVFPTPQKFHENPFIDLSYDSWVDQTPEIDKSDITNMHNILNKPVESSAILYTAFLVNKNEAARVTSSYQKKVNQLKKQLTNYWDDRVKISREKKILARQIREFTTMLLKEGRTTKEELSTYFKGKVKPEIIDEDLSIAKKNINKDVREYICEFISEYFKTECVEIIKMQFKTKGEIQFTYKIKNHSEEIGRPFGGTYDPTSFNKFMKGLHEVIKETSKPKEKKTLSDLIEEKEKEYNKENTYVKPELIGTFTFPLLGDVKVYYDKDTLKPVTSFGPLYRSSNEGKMIRYDGKKYINEDGTPFALGVSIPYVVGFIVAAYKTLEEFKEHSDAIENHIYLWALNRKMKFVKHEGKMIIIGVDEELKDYFPCSKPNGLETLIELENKLKEASESIKERIGSANRIQIEEQISKIVAEDYRAMSEEVDKEVLKKCLELGQQKAPILKGIYMTAVYTDSGVPLEVKTGPAKDCFHQGENPNNCKHKDHSCWPICDGKCYDYIEVREINKIKYKVTKTKCNCSCHSSGAMHCIPCCNNGYNEMLIKIE